MRHARRLVLAGLIAASASAPAQASFIDTDFYCRAFGCVIVHDGNDYDVYDVFNLTSGLALLPGQRLIRSRLNPIVGTGAVNPVFTGSRIEGFHALPLADESFRLGIDVNGDGILDFEPVGGTNAGFLDAGDMLNPFALTTATDLVAADSSAQRSFYLSSSTDFYMSAQAIPLSSGDALSDVARFGDIAFRYQLSRSGNDDGMAYGANARPGNQFRPIGNVTTLRDLLGGPVNIMEFRQAISFRSNPSLASQSIRFDYVYGFQNYDLSMGAGHLRYRIEFDFYNR